MQVIGAGLPRTGTLSQKVALEMLGLRPCYHMVTVLGDLDLAEQWRRALDGEACWASVFEGFEATVDWPGSFFYRDLLDAFPQARVVLSTRDGTSWERSMRQTIWDVLYGDGLVGHLSAARGEIDPKWRAYTEMMRRMWRRSGLIDGAGDPRSLAAGIERYQARVVADVAPERLLVWSVEEGWEPLCEFLELDVPDVPFPRLNDSGEFAERIVEGSMLALQQWRRAGQAEPVST